MARTAASRLPPMFRQIARRKSAVGSYSGPRGLGGGAGCLPFFPPRFFRFFFFVLLPGAAAGDPRGGGFFTGDDDDDDVGVAVFAVAAVPPEERVPAGQVPGVQRAQGGREGAPLPGIGNEQILVLPFSATWSAPGSGR